MSKILLIFILFFFNCSYTKKDDKETPNKKLVEVNYHMFICQGEASQWCLQVRDKGDTAWQYFYDTIEKFNYEWGYNYVLDVEKRNIKNPAQDASAIKWILKSVVKKTRVATNTSFSLELGEEKAVYDPVKKELRILNKVFSPAKSFPVNRVNEFTTFYLRFNAGNKPEIFQGK